MLNSGKYATSLDVISGFCCAKKSMELATPVTPLITYATIDRISIRRHTALTEKAPLLKDFNLRQHAGWVKSSNMVEIYTHELGGESSEDLLQVKELKMLMIRVCMLILVL